MTNCIRKLVLVLTMAISLAGCDLGPAQSVQRLDIPPQIRSITPPGKILFIGNSFTYFNDGIDSHLRELVRAAYPDRNILIDSLTVPNQTVKGHFRDAATQVTLSRESWDVVIVQGASYEPIESGTLKEFDKYSALIAEEIRAENAQVALFMTWAYRSKPSMIGSLASAYVKTGNNISALVVPVGLAWEQVRQQQSRAYLYLDNKHPSMHGTYLAACVFFAALFAESPIGVSYSAGLPKNDAHYLQQIAWQTTQSFFNDSNIR